MGLHGNENTTHIFLTILWRIQLWFFKTTQNLFKVNQTAKEVLAIKAIWYALE